MKLRKSIVYALVICFLVGFSMTCVVCCLVLPTVYSNALLKRVSLHQPFQDNSTHTLWYDSSVKFHEADVPDGDSDFVFVANYGWPARAVVARGHGTVKVSILGYQIQNPTWDNATKYRLLPGQDIYVVVQFVPWAIVVNSLVISFAIMFVLMPIRIAKRLLRKYRGQCLQCAYAKIDGVNTCPECGASWD